jgi:hypothetical protein
MLAELALLTDAPLDPVVERLVRWTLVYVPRAKA